jgi:hypothetical protein
VVSSDFKPTIRTHEPSLPQLNRLSLPTARTGLAGWQPLIDLYHLLASHSGHMLQNEHELGEAEVAYLPAPQLLHTAQVERFKPHHVVLVTQGMGQFEVRVTSLIGHASMCQRQLAFRLLLVAGAFLLPG